jgi:hypothetical protein
LPPSVFKDDRHRFLSEDRLLQQSVFANGTTITVNFADAAREYSETSIPVAVTICKPRKTQ